MSVITDKVNAYASGALPWHELVAFVCSHAFAKPKKMTLLDDDIETTEGSVREMQVAWIRADLPSERWIELLRLKQQGPGPASPEAVAKRASILDIVAKHGSHDQKDHGNWARSINGAGIDSDGIPEKYRSAMERRAAKLGVTPELLDATLEAALARGDRSHADWYDTIHNTAGEMAKAYGVELPVAAGVIAAMSPAREFGKNIRDAETVLRTMQEDEPFTADPEDIEAYNAKRDPKRPIVRPGDSMRPSDLDPVVLAALHPDLNRLPNITGMRDVVKAVSIARGGDIDVILGGPKVRSFYSNIADPDSNRVTIDTWMYRAMIPADHSFDAGKVQGTLADIEATGKRTQDVFQGAPGDLKGVDIPSGVGLYPMFVESVQRVAAKNGLRPHSVQAIVWEVARTDAGYKATDLEAYS